MIEERRLAACIDPVDGFLDFAPEPAARATAKDVLGHAWMSGTVSSVELSGALGGMRLFQAARKLVIKRGDLRKLGGFVRAAGGKILGGVRTPFPGTQDFSSFLLQAQASKAKVIGLANAGTDTTNCVKQAAEFGLTAKGIRLASLLLFITEVHSLGLRTAAGLIVTESFYWDLNDRTRAFTARLRQQVGPNPGIASTHAGTYAAALHYLKAVQDMGVPAAKASGADAVARMKALPTDDDAFGPGSIRADGRKLHPAYLFEVKRPEESKGPFDYYKLLQTTGAAEAFRPLDQGGCPLVKA